VNVKNIIHKRWRLALKKTSETGWWFGTFLIFPYIGNVIIPTDELIFFRGVETTNQENSDELFLFDLFEGSRLINVNQHPKKPKAHGPTWIQLVGHDILHVQIQKWLPPLSSSITRSRF